MKAYKGFNKDLTCLGFQYKEGETYHTEKAELCEEGFHACENPLDCFSYYEPGKAVYHEVEVDELAEGKRTDSKVCGKTIKIGAALDVSGICKAHFEYVNSRTTNRDHGKDDSSLSAQDRSSLSAQDRSSLSARNWSSLSARNWSSLSAQDMSSLSARNWSSLSAQDMSSLSAQDMSSLSAQDMSSLYAQDRSSLSARNWSSLSAHDRSSLSAQDMSSLSAQDRNSLSARNWSSLSARNWSSLSAQDMSSLSAQDMSSLSAQDMSSLSAGQDSVLAAFNSKAKAGIGSIIAIANRKFYGGKWVITDWAACVVDGEKIKADTWYKVENGQFVEVSE